MGLSVCYGIVEEHRGAIRADNVADGARFTVTLPVGAAEPDATSLENSPEIVIRAERQLALVVDDEVPLVNLQVDLLSDLGIDAVGVHSGHDAIEYLKANEVDLVISDVRMPGDIDGIKLYEWINRNRPKLTDHFIFVSGDMIGMKCGEFFLNSTVRRIEKPFLWDEYSKLVKDAIGRKEAA